MVKRSSHRRKTLQGKRIDATGRIAVAMGHHTTAHLLSSGLYRRLWSHTRSADPAKRSLTSARGLDRCRCLPPVGNHTPPRRRIVMPVHMTDGNTLAQMKKAGRRGGSFQIASKAFLNGNTL